MTKLDGAAEKTVVNTHDEVRSLNPGAQSHSVPFATEFGSKQSQAAVVTLYRWPDPQMGTQPVCVNLYPIGHGEEEDDGEAVSVGETVPDNVRVGESVAVGVTLPVLLADAV